MEVWNEINFGPPVSEGKWEIVRKVFSAILTMLKLTKVKFVYILNKKKKLGPCSSMGCTSSPKIIYNHI